MWEAQAQPSIEHAMSLRIAFLAAGILLACSSRLGMEAAQAQAPARGNVLEVGPGQRFTALADAVRASADGDTIRLAAGEYLECAVVARNNVTILGSGPDTVLTDVSCQGKAILVITGAGVTVRDLTLTRARVADGNGAGIRQEGGNLVVERVRFINNENGILAAGNPQSSLIVRDSYFERNGTCRGGGCSHGIYVGGQTALLRVENSVFRNTREGHHIKSRSVRTEVIGCDIADGDAGTASYLIDISNGGDLVLRDSRLQKGPLADNRGFAVAIAPEGVRYRTREILIENNTFRKDGDYPTTFVGNFTATDAVLRNNRITGSNVRPLRGDGTVN